MKFFKEGKNVKYTLLDNVTGPQIGQAYKWPGGKGAFIATGTLDSSSSLYELQVSEDNVNFVGYPDTNLGHESIITVEIPNGFYVRAEASGTFDTGDNVTCIINSIED